MRALVWVACGLALCVGLAHAASAEAEAQATAEAVVAAFRADTAVPEHAENELMYHVLYDADTHSQEQIVTRFFELQSARCNGLLLRCLILLLHPLCTPCFGPPSNPSIWCVLCVVCSEL
jgi:hypothetical protein